MVIMEETHILLYYQAHSTTLTHTSHVWKRSQFFWLRLWIF